MVKEDSLVYFSIPDDEWKRSQEQIKQQIKHSIGFNQGRGGQCSAEESRDKSSFLAAEFALCHLLGTKWQETPFASRLILPDVPENNSVKGIKALYSDKGYPANLLVPPHHLDPREAYKYGNCKTDEKLREKTRLQYINCEPHIDWRFVSMLFPDRMKNYFAFVGWLYGSEVQKLRCWNFNHPERDPAYCTTWNKLHPWSEFELPAKQSLPNP